MHENLDNYKTFKNMEKLQKLFIWLCVLSTTNLFSQYTIDYELKELNFYTKTVNWGEEFSEAELLPQHFYEAEEMVYSHASIENTHAGYTGNGYVDGYYYDKQAYVEYSHYSISGGDIYLGVVSTGLRPSVLTVNGIPVDTLYFQGANSWTKWKFTPVKLSLMPGDNVIRLQAIASNGLGNIDKFIIATKEETDFAITPKSWGYCCDNFTKKYPTYYNPQVGNYFENSGGTGMISFGIESEFDQDVTVLINYHKNSGAATSHCKINGTDIFPSMDKIGESSYLWAHAVQTITLTKGLNSFEFSAASVDIEKILIDGQDIEILNVVCSEPVSLVFDGGWDEANIPYSSYDGTVYNNYVDIDHGIGKGLEYVLYLHDDANVDFFINYAAKNDRPAQVYVNDVLTETVIPFDETGAWNIWNEQIFSLHLSKGINKIRIESTSNYGLANIGTLTASTPVNAMGINTQFIADSVDLVSLSEDGENFNYVGDSQNFCLYTIVYSNNSDENIEMQIVQTDLINNDWHEDFFTFIAPPGENQQKTFLFEYFYPSDYMLSTNVVDENIEIHDLAIIGVDLEKIQDGVYPDQDTVYAEGDEICFGKMTVQQCQYEILYANTSSELSEGSIECINGLFGYFYGCFDSYGSVSFTCDPDTESGVAKGFEGLSDGLHHYQAYIESGDAEILGIRFIGYGLSEAACPEDASPSLKSDAVATEENVSDDVRIADCSINPNIVSDNFTLAVSGSKETYNATIEVVNIAGKTVKEMQVNVAGAYSKFVVNCEGLASGVYAVYFNGGEKYFEGKFIVE